MEPPRRSLRLLLLSLLPVVTALGCRGSSIEGPSAAQARGGGAAVDETADSAESVQADAPAPAAPAAPAAPQAGERAPPGPPVDGVDKLPSLRGRTQDQAIEELGPATSKREFRMGDCCNEFEIELYNTYPPDSGHEAVAIQEWTWAYEGYAVTLWFHLQGGAWTVLETCRYSDDVEF